MAIDITESIDIVEYMNMYPSMTGGGHVFIMTAITNKGNRVLIYAPMVTISSHSIESSASDEYDAEWRRTLDEIRHRRYCKFFSEFFAVKSTDGCSEYFKVIYLDGVHKPTVRKEEIEKMFGCKIDG